MSIHCKDKTSARGVCVCVCVAHLAVTSIHFRVRPSAGLVLSLFLVLFFVLLFQALFPHTHGEGQHHAQTHDAKGGDSPWWPCNTHTHTYDEDTHILLFKYCFSEPLQCAVGNVSLKSHVQMKLLFSQSESTKCKV